MTQPDAPAPMGTGNETEEALVPIHVSFTYASGVVLFQAATERFSGDEVSATPAGQTDAEEVSALARKVRSESGQNIASDAETVAEANRVHAALSRINGVSEGFHTKMEMISRRAYGFRNFENYRLRVLAQCGWEGVVHRV